MALSYAQLEGAWVQGGGNPAKAAIAAAIAMAESGGNPNSHNGNAGTGDNSYGLWQINMLGSMGPSRRAQYNLPNNEALFDPVTNARVAVAMSNNGQNWGPWTTFTRGAYLRYLQNGVAPDTTGLNGSGNFGSAIMGGDSSTNASLASFTDNTCVLGWSGLGGIFGSTGHFCLLTKSEMRALVGGMILGTGVVTMGVSAILLVLSFSSIPSGPKKAISGMLSAGKAVPTTTVSEPESEPKSSNVAGSGETVTTPPSKNLTSKLSLKMTALKALKFIL